MRDSISSGLQKALHRAALEANFTLLGCLKKEKLDCNSKDKHGNTPLHNLINIAPYRNKNKEELLKSIELFINDKTVDLNATNSFGETPLHLAAINGNLQIVTMLIESGRVDTQIKNRWGKIPLECANTKVANVIRNYNALPITGLRALIDSRNELAGIEML
ncbi:MAG: ankyrin repeat domain-containing protein [Sphingobacteriia bacterium]|nr:ankyrin repeat domain-containing protein [Sphingobacteriia bacterium]